MADRFEQAGFKKVSPKEIASLGFEPFSSISDRWFLVTAGDENGYNTMTASWGFAGIIWNKPSFITVIRPQRYTKEFIDKAEYFTASFFPEENKSALAFCGSRSGRDVDKAKETGLTPVFGEGATAFAQAEMVFLCKKVYAAPLSGDAIVDKAVDSANYSAGDYHTQYIGEITAVYVKE